MSPNTPIPRIALTLTGGGARAAYQVGVLKGVAEITKKAAPFDILSGTSAGAINAAFLASRTSHFVEATDSLLNLWKHLQPEMVYRTDLLSLSRIGLSWARDVSLGGMIQASHESYLLDASPLVRLLHENISFEKIRQSVREGKLHGLSFTTTNYSTGTSVTFFEGQSEIEDWARSQRIGLRSQLTLKHLMASAAIPLFFPPVHLENAFYGDGAVRSQTPLSSAIHLGADKIFAIGVRYYRSPAETLKRIQEARQDEFRAADLGGALLNALFLDALDSDVERLLRINETLRHIESIPKTNLFLRKIPLLVVRPSRDLGSLACDEFKKLPRLLRYLLRGLGATEERGWDLFSYLAFQPGYVVQLIDIGYSDVLRMKNQVEDFFEI